MGVVDSAGLVGRIVPDSQPLAIRRELEWIVKELLGQGISPGDISEGLRLWLVSPYAPSSLPKFVSQVQREGSGSRINALRQAWVDGDVSRLKPFGLWFTPGPASGVADKDLAAFRKAEKREWIEGIVRGEVESV